MLTRVSPWIGKVSGASTSSRPAEHDYCIIAEWSDMDAIIRARPQMIATLDTFRHMLEDLGSGLGVTDAVSGPVVLEPAGADPTKGGLAGDPT